MTEERPPQSDEERREFREEADSLVRITLAPVIWAGHFVLCYGATALVCAKGWPSDPLRPLLIAATVAALAGIGWIGWRSFQRWDVWRTGDFTNPEGDAEDRHQFLGHAAFLLAIVSAIGVIYTALPILMIEACR